ncbi:MAG: YcxB family protein [Clostridia bacterium]|nr:YcxB family protein [Clostridia bacterium]
MGQEYTVRVRLDAKTFKRFCRFDTLRLRKKWARPTVFALIMIAFAAVALLSRRPQSGMIAAVLLAVGVGLPLVYFGTFFSQVNMQVERYNLKPARDVYTVRLNREGVHVTNDQKAEEQLDAPWKDVQAAFRAKGCAYLYVNAARAFLLPDGQADAPADELWAYIEKHMGDKARTIH